MCFSKFGLRFLVNFCFTWVEISHETETICGFKDCIGNLIVEVAASEVKNSMAEHVSQAALLACAKAIGWLAYYIIRVYEVVDSLLIVR